MKVKQGFLLFSFIVLSFFIAKNATSTWYIPSGVVSHNYYTKIITCIATGWTNPTSAIDNNILTSATAAPAASCSNGYFRTDMGSMKYINGINVSQQSANSQSFAVLVSNVTDFSSYAVLCSFTSTLTQSWANCTGPMIYGQYLSITLPNNAGATMIYEINVSVPEATLDIYLNGTQNQNRTYAYGELFNVTTVGSSSEATYFYTYFNNSLKCSTGTPTTGPATCEFGYNNYPAGSYEVLINSTASASVGYTERRNIYAIVSPATTCTYSGSGNYAIDCKDNCIFTSNLNVTGNLTIYSTGAGKLTFNNANVTSQWFKLNATHNCLMNFTGGNQQFFKMTGA